MYRYPPVYIKRLSVRNRNLDDANCVVLYVLRIIWRKTSLFCKNHAFLENHCKMHNFSLHSDGFISKHLAATYLGENISKKKYFCQTKEMSNISSPKSSISAWKLERNNLFIIVLRFFRFFRFLNFRRKTYKLCGKKGKINYFSTDMSAVWCIILLDIYVESS